MIDHRTIRHLPPYLSIEELLTRIVSFLDEVIKRLEEINRSAANKKIQQLSRYLIDREKEFRHTLDRYRQAKRAQREMTWKEMG